jgi:hypothetical protein
VAKKYEYTSAYTEVNVSSKSFDRDASYFKPPRAAEGDADTKKYPDYAGGRTDRRGAVDSELKYSGGNDGYTGGDTGGYRGNDGK